jgi:uncharacterized glyoxalase superfamily protein PhnB
MTHPAVVGVRLIPLLPDVTAALAFLVDAFVFTELDAIRDENGIVWSARVSTGDGVRLIRLEEFATRPVTDRAWATSLTFVYVDAVDGRHGRARDRGATIVTDLADHGPNRIYIANDRGVQQWIFVTPLT